MAVVLPELPELREDDVLARTIYGEARGEDRQGREAVANVVMNRVLADLHGDGKPDWWGEGVVEVCMEPYQFSCWLEGDPNRWKILAANESDPVFAECLEIARQAIAGTLPDNTNGATHYLNPALAEKLYGLPKWATPERIVARHGRHVFYRVAV